MNPRLEIEGEAVFLLTQQIGAVPTSALSTRVVNLEQDRDVVVAALDFLFSGV